MVYPLAALCVSGLSFGRVGDWGGREGSFDCALGSPDHKTQHIIAPISQPHPPLSVIPAQTFPSLLTLIVLGDSELITLVSIFIPIPSSRHPHPPLQPNDHALYDTALNSDNLNPPTH